MQKPCQEVVVMLHSEINCVFQEGDHSFKGKRFLPQDTIKFGCPAKIFMSEVVRFAGYQVFNLIMYSTCGGIKVD